MQTVRKSVREVLAHKGVRPAVSNPVFELRLARVRGLVQVPANVNGKVSR